MEIIKFIGWAIKRMSPVEMTLYPLLFWFLVMFVNLHFFGTIGFLIFFSGILLVGFIALIWVTCEKVLKSWTKYKDEQDREAQRIVDRLKGI